MEQEIKKILPVTESKENDFLKGIRVVELAEYVAGPICSRMLADYGAEVIKIERSAGDPYRRMGKNLDCGGTDEENPIFDVLNSGKKSVLLNLRNAEDVEALHKILSTADVFVTSNRMLSLRKKGLDPETLCTKYPKLVYAMITGYGIDGPDKDTPGFDSVAFWGRTGVMRGAYKEPGAYPIPSPWAVGDAITGSILFSGVMSALYKREHTGKGDFVTASLYGSSIWANCVMATFSQPKYGFVYPKPRYESPTNGTFCRCADDEWIQYGFENWDHFMPKFFEILGVPDLIKDPRFNSRENCNKNSAVLLPIIEKQFLTKTSKEWLKELKENDFVCCILPQMKDIAADPQAWANGNVEQFTMGNGDTCVLPCPPIRFGSTGTVRSKLGPMLGEDTAAVFAECGIKRDAK